ncbi:MAG: thermonuclease family protein [Hyphomonadaceae bacterium]
MPGKVLKFQKRRKRGGRGLAYALVLVAALGLGAGAYAMFGSGFSRSASAAATKAEIDMLSGTASVIDADTIEIHGERIRFDGIDAPESGQRCKDASGALYRCGQQAANALDTLIGDNQVSCRPKGRDRYDRMLAQCFVRGQDINRWLVARGHALAYRQYSMEYVPYEITARDEKAGMWAGDFVAPWDWRRGARLKGETPTRAMLDGRFEPK